MRINSLKHEAFFSKCRGRKAGVPRFIIREKFKIDNKWRRNRIIPLLLASASVVFLTLCKKPERELSIKTLDIPTATISYRSAIVRGEVIDVGSSPLTEHGFLLSQHNTPSLTNSVSYPLGEKSSHGTFEAEYISLLPATTYHVKAYGISKGSYHFGETKSFITQETGHAQFGSFSLVSNTDRTAVFSVEIVEDGGESVIKRGLCWSTEADPTIVTAIDTTNNGSGTGFFNATVINLAPLTTYYLKAWAINEKGTSYSNQVVFSTHGLPDIATSSVSGVSNSGATSGGEIVNAGGVAITARGITWNTSGSPTVALSTKTTDNLDGNSYTSVITGLTPNTTYYVRAYATNSYGSGYGAELTFKTTIPPIVATLDASPVGNTTATLRGRVNPLGYSTTVTFEYGPTTAYGSFIEATPSVITGTTETEVSALVSGLMPGNTIHYRVVAVSEGGTTYGNAKTAVTLEGPEPVTMAATNIGNTGATLHGGVNANNSPTDVSFEYGTTTSYGSVKTATPSQVTGNTHTDVSAVLTGLTPGIVYHYRVKAVSVGGTSYGGNMTFRTLEPPTATTLAATNIGNNSTTFNATVNPNFSQTTVTFEYGLTQSYGSTIGATPGNVTGSTTTAVLAEVSGLEEGVTYNYRLKAESAGGITYGANQSFTTLKAPSVTTVAASALSSSGAVLNGTVNPHSFSATVTFEWGLTTDYGLAITAAESPVSGNTSVVVTANLEGLASGTRYYYRTKAESQGGTVYGSGLSFITLSVPEVTTTTATEVLYTSARSGGTISSTGGTEITARGVVYSLTPNPDITGTKTGEGSGSGSYSSNIAGLTPGTKYYYRAYATNSVGTSYGEELTFTTLVASVPVLSTMPASEITTSGGKSGGNISNDGGSPVTARGVCWSTSPNPTTVNNKTEDGEGSGVFVSQITGLTGNTTYYVRAYATNGAGTGYGEELSFTTTNPTPILKAYYPFNNNTNDESENNYNASNHGGIFVYNRFLNTLQAFLVSDSYIDCGEPLIPETTDFSVLMWIYPDSIGGFLFGQYDNDLGKGLYSGINSETGELYVTLNGDSNSEISSQTSLELKKWYMISLIRNRDTLSLYINDHFEAATQITQATIVQINNLIIGNRGDSQDTGNGFRGIIDDIRIYDGEIPQETIVALYSDNWDGAYILTDIDENTYSVVHIGEQVWMAENLKTSRLKNGIQIKLEPERALWQALTTPGYCFINNNESYYKPLLGALYNWHAVSTEALCPLGWTVPSHYDWTELAEFLGNNVAAKLKTIDGWNTFPGTNSSGFSAKPAGLRSWQAGGDLGYMHFNFMGYWWSSTLQTSTEAIIRSLSTVSAYFNTYQHPFSNGLSVRCIKDN